MRIEIQYIKDFLEIVLALDQPDFYFEHSKIRPLWDNLEKRNKFVFHMEILEDQNIIKGLGPDKGIGIVRSGNAMELTDIPIRVTAEGHQFYSDLSKPGVIKQVTTTFKEAGPSEVVKIVFELGKKVLEKKLENLIE